MNGVLVINKPSGPTSHDVVAMVRKAWGEAKVGHTGTLDPTATGVLPLVLGQATKLARFVSGGDKTYRATFRLGIVTDTLDAAGQVQQTAPVLCSEAEVRAAATKFVGEIEQLPPMFSAKKVEGRKLYELARRGVAVERASKRVQIHDLVVLEVALPDVKIEVKCSSGTYVRVLAHDFGAVLGCGASLWELCRLEAGPFALRDAITLDEALEDVPAARTKVMPVARALAGLPRLDVPGDIARRVAAGYQLTVADLRTVDAPRFAAGQMVALGADGGGEVVAVLCAEMPSCELSRSRRDSRVFKTQRVLSL